MDYICENYDEIERELNGDEYKESKKHNYNFCVACNKEMLLDSQKSILVCTKCGLCEYYPVYVTSYNHSMKPLRRKCVYNRSDNFKGILNQFLYGGKHRDNILCNYEIPLTIPVLEFFLKRNKMTKYKNSKYHYIFFKLNSQPIPYITTKEYNMILNVFNVVSSIYDIYKPKGTKSF